MFYQFLVSPQEKQYASITYKHVTYEFHHEMSNDLTLTISGNYEISIKGLNFIE